jgi:hypothetical protein
MEGNRPANKMDILRDALERLERAAGTDQAASVEGSTVARIGVPVDQIMVEAISEVDPKVVLRDDRPGDPLAAYVACLKSLCETTGGTWIDDRPGKHAGCYFRSNPQAAGYAALAWTCLPGGFLRYVLG